MRRAPLCVRCQCTKTAHEVSVAVFTRADGQQTLCPRFERRAPWWLRWVS